MKEIEISFCKTNDKEVYNYFDDKSRPFEKRIYKGTKRFYKKTHYKDNIINGDKQPSL